MLKSGIIPFRETPIWFVTHDFKNLHLCALDVHLAFAIEDPPRSKYYDLFQVLNLARLVKREDREAVFEFVSSVAAGNPELFGPAFWEAYSDLRMEQAAQRQAGKG
jgi:hypothetical protein